MNDPGAAAEFRANESSHVPSSSRRIAFVRPGPHPIPNRLLPDYLARVFPDHEIDILDVVPLVKRRPQLVLGNLALMLWQYGRPLLARSMTRWGAFFTTDSMLGQMNQLIRKRLVRRRYSFTFQIQSLFDASIERTPHFVYTDHTALANLTYPGFDERSLPSPSWLRHERDTYHNARLNFTRSSNISRSLVDQYGCDPERVCQVGAGSNAQLPATEPRNDGYRNKNILFVGGDWQRKGGPDLVTAFETVQKSHPDATLTIVGCRPRVELRNCTVVGPAPVEEVHRFYEQASIFCLPTRLEPFGVVFVEALHQALPVVATRLGAIPDLVEHGENGFLVEPGDSRGLARYLIRLLDDPPLCRTMGRKGQSLARAEYTWERVAQKMRQAIESTLGSD